MHYVQSGRYVQNVDAQFAAQTSLRTLAVPAGEADASPFGVSVITDQIGLDIAACSPANRTRLPSPHGSRIPPHCTGHRTCQAGMVRVGPKAGSAISDERWALPPAALGRFLAALPALMSLGRIQLDSGPACNHIVTTRAPSVPAHSAGAEIRDMKSRGAPPSSGRQPPRERLMQEALSRDCGHFPRPVPTTRLPPPPPQERILGPRRPSGWVLQKLDCGRGPSRGVIHRRLRGSTRRGVGAQPGQGAGRRRTSGHPAVLSVRRGPGVGSPLAGVRGWLRPPPTAPHPPTSH
ncbi:hypothetical protein SAMN04487981_115115 [Streptomyces sp. cf386]|nr:hypothetical protein SAMN04487981_115115 [Streptomyces sp. cf386]